MNRARPAHVQSCEARTMREDAMLAEIYMLRLEMMARMAKEIVSTSSRRVPVTLPALPAPKAAA
jgi:hypothetical protein